MKCGPWLVAVAVALMPAAAASAVVQFAAPAGDLPAGQLRAATFDAVLPSGRLVTPFGTSVVTGIDAWGVALTPDGKFAVVSNTGGGQGQARSAVDPRIFGGPSLAAIDTATMRVVDRFVFPGETYFAGVTALADPVAPGRTVVFAGGGASGSVAVVDLDATGHFTPDLHHRIALPPLDAGVQAAPAGVAATLVAARDGRHVYVVDTAGDRVGTIDTTTRSLGTTAPVGFAPFGAALAGDRLLVANEGLMHYARVADAPLVPPFATPPADPLEASSLSLVGIGLDGTLPAAPGAMASSALAMDVTPDGLRVVGGAHPGAIAVTPDAGYAFVAMTGVDRIASVRLGARPEVAGGTELRLFDRGPYGTQPAALALSSDGTRLYVALAGLDAVAVLDARDPVHLHRLGLIPTGWFPRALALSSDDRTLYVLNGKGFGHDAGFTGDPATGADARAVWSTLQKVDLGAAGLSSTTYTTLKNTRQTSPSPPRYPGALRDVVVILEASKTFDAMLGDLGYGPADPQFVRFGAAVTPNLHALARRFAVAGNFFADAPVTPFTERADSLWGAAGAEAALPAGRADPEDSPRAGYLLHNLARHHIPFRDYGDWVQLTGYDGGRAPDPVIDDPAFAGAADRSAPTHGLGGRYTADVPAPLQLGGRIDPDFPGANLRIRDERRAREFIRDYGALVAAHRRPRYTQIRLPADRGVEGPGLPPAAEQLADADRALGAIVASISRQPAWKRTAIFILPDDTGDARDHVDVSRAYAIVVSPFAKRRFVGMRHLSTVSVLKTAEEILGIPPLGLGDLVATDMSDFFTSAADARPFAALDVPDPTAAALDRNLRPDAERHRPADR